jgi:hypothetical protein
MVRIEICMFRIDTQARYTRTKNASTHAHTHTHTHTLVCSRTRTYICQCTQYTHDARRLKQCVSARAHTHTTHTHTTHAHTHTHTLQLARALPHLFDKSLPVTDFGCGIAYYIQNLSQKGYTVHAVEGTPGIESIALYKPIIEADLSEPLTLDIPQGVCMCVYVCNVCIYIHTHIHTGVKPSNL